MKKAIFQLKSLTCPSCIQKLEETIYQLDGIQSVKILFNLEKAIIVFDREKLDKDVITEAIEQLGYEISAIKIA